jgi:membrane protease YdiL (CAAX protease family)
MNSPTMPAPDDLPVRAPSRARRILLSAPSRIVVAVLALGLTAALTFPTVKAVFPTPAQRFIWPYLLATALMLLVYAGLVRLMERRAMPELGLRGAGREFGLGIWLGALAVAAAISLLALAGNYHLAGSNPWSSSMASSLAEMFFVGVFEELLFRAVIFRIAERALGSWPALILSSILFALAHLGESISPLGLAITAVAGLMLSAAWMVSRRLWLCVGIHMAWNYTLGTVFSIAVSSHPAKGWLIGSLSGPEWMTGGVYGLEGSLASLIVIGALFVILYRQARVKGNVIPARWSATRGTAAQPA